MPALWKVWDLHFARRPVHPNRKFITSRLAYRLQERAFGSLPQSTRERLADFGQNLSKIKSTAPAKAVAMPGATLVREFDGKEYRVQVLADVHGSSTLGTAVIYQGQIRSTNRSSAPKLPVVCQCS